MAEKSDRLGLLSKMALFVKNPTKDWSDLDRPEPAAESGYDKNALKAMIERKRQNDFVRRREFDQLRKLRRQENAGVGGIVRPSIFQTSVATDPDGRAVTLKKIDEIEAQMSKQWWKGKLDSANPASNAQDAAAADSEGFPVAKPAEQNPGYFETTQNAESVGQGADYTETQMGVGMAPAAGNAALARPAGDRFDAMDVGFSASKLFATEATDMATDPELEEAAIRFANGDDTGAENGLLQALRADALQPEVALSWAAALLDFYRATNHRTKFEAAVAEFALRFGEQQPAWVSIADGGGLPSAPEYAAPSGAMWESPAELTLAAMESLRETLSSQPMPWSLEWSRLSRIHADAMPLLEGLFGSLCEEPVQLRFGGAQSLVQTLRAMMPSGDRSISPAWWATRLNVLRTLQLIDEFELAALDYCVTFEVAPPAWVPARCDCENLPASATLSNAATAPMGLDGAPATHLELRGDVLGDASQALASMGEIRKSGDRIVVSCQGLIRVDFSAAGSILNWVALRQAEGCQVQFKDVQRLVAAFFNVIGINEHARVVPRSI